MQWNGVRELTDGLHRWTCHIAQMAIRLAMPGSMASHLLVFLVFGSWSMTLAELPSQKKKILYSTVLYHGHENTFVHVFFCLGKKYPENLKRFLSKRFGHVDQSR